MKKFPKLTVLASTVLLSTVFSPTSHADDGQVYRYDVDPDVQASENVYKYDAVTEDTKTLKEENTESINNTSNKEVNEEPSLEMDEDYNENIVPLKAAKASDQDLTKADAKETTKEKETSSNAEPKATSVKVSTPSFEHKDVYKYTKVDLDNGYIARTSTKTKGQNQSKPKTESKNEEKVVDKTSDGRYVLKSDGKNSYYYDNGKLMKNKDTVLNGKFYTLDSNGVATVARNKWVNVNGVKYYANENGYTQLGLKKIGNTTYHFEQNGKLSSNKTVLDNGTFYRINNQGIAQAIKNEWIDYGGQTFYVNEKGGRAQGLTEIGGKEYFFDKNGSMVENESVVYKGDKFYRVDSKGKATMYKNSWVNYNGKEFYVNENGWRCQGITKINGKVYNLTKNGKAKDYYAYSERDNATYYFDSNGVGKAVAWGKPSKDLDLLVGWMYDGMNNNMTYSMSAARTSATASDCSSAVFRSMIYGGFLDKGSFIGNTETLFDLGRKGVVLKEIKESDIRYGDIFVAGVPGKSLGAGGHTGVILDKNTIIHSNYTDNGISKTPRKGRMGDASGYPVRYYRLVGGTSRRLYI